MWRGACHVDKLPWSWCRRWAGWKECSCLLEPVWSLCTLYPGSWEGGRAGREGCSPSPGLLWSLYLHDKQNNLERRKSSSTIVSCIYLWIQDLKKCHSNHFFFQAVKADKACYSLNLSPPSVISFSESRLLYFLFTPLFHACCALFSFTFYYPVQSGFYLLFSSVHLILFCSVFLSFHISKCTIFPIVLWTQIVSMKSDVMCFAQFCFMAYWKLENVFPNTGKYSRPYHKLTHHLKTLTHLLQCPCWPATSWQWGRHWKWHSVQSWAWRAWMWFLKRMTHRSSGIHHTFQLHTFHCWSTVAEKRNREGSTGQEDSQKERKCKLREKEGEI